MSDDTADLKAQWDANKAQWEGLCAEQEQLYSPEFERAFNTLFEIAPEQQEVFNTMGWNLNAMLPEAIDTDAINRALQVVGFDESQSANFKRYAEITLQGKRLQQQNVKLNIAIESKKFPEELPSAGWRFIPVHILAPQNMHNIIGDIIKEDAINGKGLFSNFTKVDGQLDESLDALLCVDQYSVIGNFQHYLAELRRYKVDALLKADLTKYLFTLLKKITDFIKANTDKPEATKKYILDAITELDKYPIYGLIFQILTLQGLVDMFDHCNLNEGDTGYNEAQELLNWIGDLLARKIVWFAYQGGIYSDNDKKALQPICDYLYNTDMGHFVQDAIFNRKLSQPADASNENVLPVELDTERARKYFARAVEAGYMTRTDTGYKWLFGGERGALARLGYFLYRTLCPTNTEKIPQQAVNKLFGVNRIDSAIAQLLNAKKPQKWRNEIDKLFAD